MLSWQGLSKTYDTHTAVAPCSFTIEAGEFVTILGPSGCGKTTLLRMLAGLVEPTAGAIELDGSDITALPPYRRDLNMVFQQYALFPHMTVEENIRFGLRMKKVPVAEQRERVARVIELTQLSGLERRKPQQLSGGQQQRVAVARAVVNRPKVLLLDEPLAALDLQLRKSLQTELKQLQKTIGITFIYVTHDQEEAMTLSDRIVVMNAGICEQTGAPRAIYDKPASRFVASFIGENNVLEQDGMCFAVRPEHVRLYRSAEAAPDGSRGVGTIEDIADIGSLLKVHIRADAGSGAKRIVAYRYGDDRRDSYALGEQIGYGWAASDEVVLTR
jgi:spermidine/putrescine transport system ATP-binding protein